MTRIRPIVEVARDLGLDPETDLIPYGHDKAKVRTEVLQRPRQRPEPGRLILVSAITPTPAGEGKTTTTIGLSQAMGRLGINACAALREPSLGPCFGIKGGGTGGGASRLEPSVDINLHFNGDFHAITAAHNLLAAVLDNHLHFKQAPGVDARRVFWRRVLDVNDRSLRSAVLGLGGPLQGMPRETGFDITAASEIMAMLCLAKDAEDLRARLDRTLVALGQEREPIRAGQLGCTGAMMALLKDALLPNLVQTREGTPVLVHGGPFANIAHGCNSLIATKTALHLADWAITEAGFGFDLGAEKFFHLKCTEGGINPDGVVLVATARALKMHGGTAAGDLQAPDPKAVRRGLGNLEKHIETAKHFGYTPVVAINRFEADSEDELKVILARCADLGCPAVLTDHFMRGGEGAEALAQTLIEHVDQPAPPFQALYRSEHSVKEKIRRVACSAYGARDILLTKTAERDLRQVKRLGYDHLPICIAKTQSSLSDDPKRVGRPQEFDVTVRNVQINAGAGFLVILTGNIMRMPGLPRTPQAEKIDLVDGEITGLR